MEINSMITPWDYFENYKYKQWYDLTGDEQDRLTLAVNLIQSDLGIIPSSNIQIKLFLQNNMPLKNLPTFLN